MNKRNLKIVSIFLSIVMCIAMIPMSAMAAGPRVIANLTCDSSTVGNLDTDGYHWDKTTNTLTLKNVNIDKLDFKVGGSADAYNKVTIKVAEGPVKIEKLELGDKASYLNIEFAGTNPITVNSMTSSQPVNIKVLEGAKVISNSGINIGTSGGKDSALEVDGELIIDASSEATPKDFGAYLEDVYIGSTGKLIIKNFQIGLKLQGKFEIVEGGIFESNATDCNLMIYRESNDPTGDEANYMIVPANYIPKGYEIKVVEDDNNNYALTIAPKTSNPTLSAESVSGAGGVLEIKEQTPEAPAVPETTKKVETTKKAETTTKKTEVKAENPPTADNTNAVAWAVAALATIGGYSYVSLKRKSEENA